jgi:hypothetical protein
MAVAPSTLKPLARKYLWWKTPDEAVAFPERLIAQVMDLGDFEDVAALVAQAGEAELRDVLLHAEAGQFSARSWAYWHYRLGIARVGEVPPLPERRFA